MKRYLFPVLTLLLHSSLVGADAPRFSVLTTKSLLLVTEGDDAVEIHAQSRILKIQAPAAGATAYKIDIFTRDANGSRRTWTFVAPRHEQRYGRFEDRTSATFFTIPIDLDIPLLDIFVSALSVSGEAPPPDPSSR